RGPSGIRPSGTRPTRPPEGPPPSLSSSSPSLLSPDLVVLGGRPPGSLGALGAPVRIVSAGRLNRFHENLPHLPPFPEHLKDITLGYLSVGIQLQERPHGGDFENAHPWPLRGRRRRGRIRLHLSGLPGRLDRR